MLIQSISVAFFHFVQENIYYQLDNGFGSESKTKCTNGYFGYCGYPLVHLVKFFWRSYEASSQRFKEKNYDKN